HYSQTRRSQWRTSNLVTPTFVRSPRHQPRVCNVRFGATSPTWRDSGFMCPIDSVFLLRPDLPEITASLVLTRLSRTRSTASSNQGVDGATAVSDHKHEVYDPVARDAIHIQVDLRGARAICPNRIGTCLTHAKVG